MRDGLRSLSEKPKVAAMTEIDWLSIKGAVIVKKGSFSGVPKVRLFQLMINLWEVGARPIVGITTMGAGEGEGVMADGAFSLTAKR